MKKRIFSRGKAFDIMAKAMSGEEISSEDRRTAELSMMAYMIKDDYAVKIGHDTAMGGITVEWDADK